MWSKLWVLCFSIGAAHTKKDYSALSLENEYSSYETTVATEDPEDEDEWFGSTRSGWDFFKDVVKKNLGPNVAEPDMKNIPESRHEEQRPADKKRNGGKRRRKFGGKQKGEKRRKNEDVEDFESEPVGSSVSPPPPTSPPPPCSSLLPIDLETGVPCWNDTIVWTRDPVMEKLLTQLWETFDPVANSSGWAGSLTPSIDPLPLSEVLPGGGALHVDRETSFFAADLWMWGVTVRGLSQGYLSDIVITRNQDLTQMNIAVEFTIDEVTADGQYNVTGWMGWEWMPIQSDGQRPFVAAMINGTLAPQITIDTAAECDDTGGAKITEFNIPLLYDTLTFDLEGLDKTFDSVIQGILVILLETQNVLAVAAIRALVARTVGSLMCP